MSDGLQKMVETLETKSNFDVYRKKQGRGRSQSASGRGRGSRVSDQTKSQNSSSMTSQLNGHPEDFYQKVFFWHPSNYHTM